MSPCVATHLTAFLLTGAGTASHELVQSDLAGTAFGAPLTPPSTIAANASDAAKWCRTQCCNSPQCNGWTSSTVTSAAALTRCHLKGSDATVGTIGGGGCLAKTMGQPGMPDGSGSYRCVSGLRGLELAVDGGGPAVPVFPKNGEVSLNVLADKMVAEIFVEDARGEGADAITAVFGGVCAECAGATVFSRGGAAVTLNAAVFVIAAVN